MNTRGVKWTCFIVTGGLVAFAAALQFGRLANSPFNGGIGFELQVIAGVIIGGVGLFGGRGTAFGRLIGVLILGMLTSGLILMGEPELWGRIGSGILILSAAGFDLAGRRSDPA